MSDNKNRSRADEIFDMLNELNGDSSASASDSNESDGVDDVLGILSSGKGDSSPQDDGESNIPTSIFSHLSEEGDGDVNPHTAPADESPHFSSHFSEDDGSTPPPPADEVDEAPKNEKPEKKGRALEIAGGIFSHLSLIPKAVVYIAIVVIVSAYLAYYIIAIGNDVFALVADTRSVTVTIPENATHAYVAEILESEGIIEYGWVYEIYMKYRGDGDSSNEYISGEHTLNTNYNYSQIITALTAKNVKREIVRVTVPEGFTVDQIIDLLVDAGVGQREDYVEAINNYPYKWKFVQLLDEMGYSEHRKYRLEGYLYPDTYDFYTTESEVFVINKMLNAFNDKFWKDFTHVNGDGTTYQEYVEKEYGFTFDDLIVLASMVQSEGRKIEDFYAISYVFHNRLSHPQSFPKLESDATIQYVLPERISDSTQLDPNYESPYNTYLYNGLPPGAISSPGLDALSAAMFPSPPQSSSGKDIDAYFFVSNDAGKTYYASSASGHEKNVVQAKKDNEAIKNGTYEQ
ncbi:MAG: endolytic transglycosylase MltG [Clostridia bacterium]|nr:endolytic transglycosylase MltG [Clostridia bacterium]